MSDRITLVDVDNWSQEAFFGPCRFCGYEGIAVYQDLIFKDRNNIEFKVSRDEPDIRAYYFESKKMAKKAIKEVEEERIKKYLFGVEE